MNTMDTLQSLKRHLCGLRSELHKTYEAGRKLPERTECVNHYYQGRIASMDEAIRLVNEEIDKLHLTPKR